MIKQFTKLLCGLVLLIISGITEAQVSSYTFTSSSGTYTPVTGGTAIKYGNAVTESNVSYATLDDEVYYNRPIGFSFVYNGTSYTSFGFNSNGWLTLGSNNTFTNTTTPISSTTPSNIVSATAFDIFGGIQIIGTVVSGNNFITVNAASPTTGINVGDSISGSGIPASGAIVTAVTGTTVTIDKNTTSGSTSASWRARNGEIRYETIGSGSSRTLVLQFSGFARFATTYPGDRMNFQIRLNETTNTVQIVYGVWSATYTGTGGTLQVGLKGATSADFNNRTTTADWAASTAGTANTSAIRYNSTVLPSNGLSYTWTASACPSPSPIISSITTTSASATFTSSGTSFILEYGALGFTPGTSATPGTGGTIITSASSPISITGLTPGTTYDVYMRQNCTSSGNGYGVNSPVTSFTTAAIAPANDNVCGAVTVNASPNTLCSTLLTGQSTIGATQSLAGCVGTADEDVWYKFTATDTMHTITLTNSGSGATDRVHQIFSSSDNTCTGTLTSVKCSDDETSTTGGLTIGKTYFVRVYSYTSTTTSFATFDICITSPAILPPPPGNDNASGAITLTVGAGCTSSPYSNVAATQGATEKFASCYQSAVTGTSSTVATHTVWFKFVAPTSGVVRVSTDLGGGTLSDTHLGLFSATDASDYNTFNIISCDDDNGTVGSTKSILFATGLTAGTTYYVSLDGFNGSTGTFCIAVDELSSSMLATTATCTSSVQTPSGTQASYTGQVPIVDGSGRLIAIVNNPAGGSVSAYTTNHNVNTGAIRQSGGTYYLDRNYRISNTTATNVNVQLFFLNSELTALAAVDPTSTLTNLGVTRQTEASAGCYNNFNLANGAITFIPQTGNGSAGGVSWINFTTPAFSNFYLNRAGTSLPISLEYLKGLKAGTGNALNWKVNCTSVSITMELERSSDSRSFKSITSITATQARCGQPFDYTDAAPLKGTNYYRLKMIDVDGKVSYSPIVAIINGASGAELVGIYPTVVRDEAFLSVAASRSTKMQINITDMSGRIIRTISQTVANGSSLININTAQLSSGVYNITGVLDGAKTKTLRFVKQ